MEPKFATPQDFFEYWGYDLDNLLRSNDNNSIKAETFLFRVETRLMRWIDANTFRNIRFDTLTPFQLEQMKYAVIEQAMYMWRNGDIGMESGFDQEKGKIIGRGDLNYLEVSQPTLNCLKLAGLFNQKMKNYRRTIHGWGATLGDYIGTPGSVSYFPPEPGPVPTPTPTPTPVPGPGVIPGIGYTEDD